MFSKEEWKKAWPVLATKSDVNKCVEAWHRSYKPPSTLKTREELSVVRGIVVDLQRALGDAENLLGTRHKAADARELIAKGQKETATALKILDATDEKLEAREKQLVATRLEAYIADRQKMIKALETKRQSARVFLAAVQMLQAQAAEALADAKKPENAALIEDLLRVAEQYRARSEYLANRISDEFRKFCARDYDEHRLEAAHIKKFDLTLNDVKPHNQTTWRTMQALRTTVDGIIRETGNQHAEVAAAVTEIGNLGLSWEKLIVRLVEEANKAGVLAEKEFSSIKTWLSTAPTRDARQAVVDANKAWQVSANDPGQRANLARQNQARLTKLDQTIKNVTDAIARLDAEPKRLDKTIAEEHRQAEELVSPLARFEMACAGAKDLWAVHKVDVPLVKEGFGKLLG